MRSGGYRRSQKFNRIEPKVWLNVLQGITLIMNELSMDLYIPESGSLAASHRSCGWGLETDRHVRRLFVKDNRVNRIMVALPMLRRL